MHLIYVCNFITQWSPKCFVHSCEHLQGGENENMNIIMRSNYYTLLKTKIV
jgi:hypothetical protein